MDRRQRKREAMLAASLSPESEMRRRKAFEERLRSPQAWVKELEDMDSFTKARLREHAAGTKSKRKLVAVPREEAEAAVANAVVLRARGRLREASDVLYAPAHSGFAAAQHLLAMLYVDAARDADATSGRGTLGAGDSSPVYYKKARKLLKKSAAQVWACSVGVCIALVLSRGLVHASCPPDARRRAAVLRHGARPLCALACMARRAVCS
jgi:hypothetical protein